MTFIFNMQQGFAHVPYCWVSWVLVPLILWFAVRARKSDVRLVFFNISFILALFGAVELYLSSRAVPEPPPIAKQEEFLSSRNKSFVRRDGELGYSPVSDHRVTHKEKFVDGQSRVTVYTIDASGLREAVYSGEEEKEVREAIVFFGGSAMFGEGVNDREVIPYYVGKDSDWNYRIYNFGFCGYGAQHMLALLQSGKVSSIVRKPPRLVVYQGSVDDLDWVAKERPGWKRYGSGPKYFLGSEGALVRGGYSGSEAGEIFQQLLDRSYVIHTLVGTLVNRGNEKLYVKIIQASRDFIKRRYPESEFNVIFWNVGEAKGRANHVIGKLRRSGIETYAVSEMIPDYDPYRERYVLRNKNCPSPAAYKKIAGYIWDKFRSGHF